MIDVLISEFIDNDAVSSLKKNFKVHYDPELWSKSKELMNLVGSLTKNKKEINLEDSKKIFSRISDYNDYTKIEKQTVAYIRKKYKFTTEANKWLRTEIRKEAATRVKDKRTKDPTNNEFKDDTPMWEPDPEGSLTVEMKYNRMILYEADHCHGAILNRDMFKVNPRLVQVFFM